MKTIMVIAIIMAFVSECYAGDMTVKESLGHFLFGVGKVEINWGNGNKTMIHDTPLTTRYEDISNIKQRDYENDRLSGCFVPSDFDWRMSDYEKKKEEKRIEIMRWKETIDKEFIDIKVKTNLARKEREDEEAREDEKYRLKQIREAQDEEDRITKEKKMQEDLIRLKNEIEQETIKRKEEERIAKIISDFHPASIGSDVTIKLKHGGIVEGTLKKISKEGITIVDLDKGTEMTLYKHLLSLESAKCFYYSTNNWKNIK